MNLRSALARAGFAAAVLLGAGCSDGDVSRDDSGAIEEEGDVNAFDVEVGDCFDDPEGFEEGQLDEIFDLPAVPCSQPHDNEAFALVELEGDDDEFPGQQTVGEQGLDLCLEEFEPYVGIDYDSSSLAFDAYLTPTEESWKLGDREVVCALYDGELAPLTGSMKGSAK